jgi:hypothetical protein
MDKPYIGVNFKAARQPDIQKACGLLLVAALIPAALAWKVALFVPV